MNQALIDNSLLGSAFVLALLITRFTRQRKAGSIASFFLLFAPLIVFLNMWAHTVAVSIVNIERFQAGTFQYTFSFYALILLGIVFIVVSGVNIDCARKIIKGDLTRKSRIHWLNFASAMLFVPLIFINPIASLPVLAAIVSSLTLWIMKPPVQTLVYERIRKSYRERETRVSV